MRRGTWHRANTTRGTCGLAPKGSLQISRWSGESHSDRTDRKLAMGSISQVLEVTSRSLGTVFGQVKS
ncbi:MAG: hypothetical protein ABJA67_08325, partial [Chthonomonadales bacterium]